MQSDLTKDEEEYFWRSFASCGGVRLKFEITAENTNLRKMVYQENHNPVAIIQEIQNLTQKTWNKKFVF